MRAVAVAHGACDLEAVRYLLSAATLQRSSPAAIEVGSLARYDRLLAGREAVR